jgi:hypothetical protein
MFQITFNSVLYITSFVLMFYFQNRDISFRVVSGPWESSLFSQKRQPSRPALGSTQILIQWIPQTIPPESGIEIREYGRRDPSRWSRGTLYPQKLTSTSPTNGGRSVRIVRSRTKATEFVFIPSEYDSWTMKLTVQIHLVLTLRKNEALPPLPHTPS